MRRFILRRLLVAVLVLVSVSVVAFSLLRLSGNLAAILAGEGASAADIAKVAAQYGLDRSLPIQYLDWAGHALSGDLGHSLFNGDPVVHLIMSRIGVTATLAFASLALGLLLAIPLGVLAALRPNSWLDRASLALAVFGQAVPNFWFGLILIYVFGVQWRILPVSGSADWTGYVLPTICLGVGTMPSLMRLTRAGMIEVLGSDYVRTARAKGLGRGAVVVRHGLRNAMLPVVSIAAVQLGTLLGGSVIVESVFSLNGVGTLAFQAIANGDFPVVQSILVFLAASYVALTFLAELINARLDPRIRA